MPLSRSESAPRSVAPYRLVDRARRRAPRSKKDGPTDGAIRHWLGAFHLLHTDGAPLIPVALRMEPAPDAAANGDANRSARQIVADRCVYEVARRQGARGEVWVLVMWEVDVPSVLFCDCADRAEALALFAEPAKATGRWKGARLRPEARPW